MLRSAQGQAVPEAGTRQIIRQTIRGTALVMLRTRSGLEPAGAGWLVDRQQKLLVTCQHVVENADVAYAVFPVYKDGKLITEKDYYMKLNAIAGRVLDTDVPHDLAVIELDSLPAEAEALPLATAPPEQGATVHSIGHPASSDALWVYAPGIVRALYHKTWWSGSQRNSRVVETQSPIYFGDSGGPLVNDDGEVVGVAHGRLGAANAAPLVSSFIDVREVRAFVEQTRRLQHPGNARAYCLRGHRLRLRGRYDRAIDDFSEALRLDPANALAYFGRAAAFNAKGDFDTALADSTEAVRLAPQLADAYCERGYAYRHRGQLDQAIADCTRAIQLAPRHLMAHHNRGYVYQLQGHFDRAIADYDEAIRLDPGYALAYVHRGEAHFARKECDRAIADYQSALEHHQPETVIVLNKLGLALAAKGDYVLAIKAYSTALELDPQSAASYAGRGSVLEDAGKYDLAEDDYIRAIALDRNYAKLYPIRFVSSLRIINDSGEPLRIYLQYETLVDGKWAWLPADPKAPALTYDWAAGHDSFMAVKTVRVEARRVRIWAEGKTTGVRLVRYQKVDLWLVKEGYRLRRPRPFRFEF
jgi:tetratricopeptide (TPR) repeat protein